MATPDYSRLQDRIDWHFTVALQGQVSRYGTFHGVFYKQYLPAGIPVPNRHPPKRIPKALYDRAKMISEQE